MKPKKNKKEVTIHTDNKPNRHKEKKNYILQQPIIHIYFYCNKQLCIHTTRRMSVSITKEFYHSSESTFRTRTTSDHILSRIDQRAS